MWQKIKKIVWAYRGIAVVIPIVSGVVYGLRWSGMLQPYECTALDHSFQQRPLEPPDNRILIVGVTEPDIQKLKQGSGSMPDQILATLLTKIKLYHPRVIGLDLYRDLPIPPGHDALVNLYKSTPNLVGIEKVVGDPERPIINPPPELDQQGQVASSDVTPDSDGVIRRGMLLPDVEGKESLRSLGLDVAVRYLDKQGIAVSSDPENHFLQIGQTVFPPFQPDDGGYKNDDVGGYQILLNYRGPAKTFHMVSVVDVLENRVPSNLIRDRIVLIGAQAEELHDYHYTPYNTKRRSSTPPDTIGVEIQANIASQVISAVLENRPLIKVLDEPQQIFYIIIWAGISTTLIWSLRDYQSIISFLLKSSACFSMLTVALVYMTYLSFLHGWWLPVVAPLSNLTGSTILIVCFIFADRQHEENRGLKRALDINEDQKNDLKDKNDELLQYSSSLADQTRDLEESDRNLNLALEFTSTGIWEWNIKTKEITGKSKNFHDLLGLETGNFKRTQAFLFQLVHHEDINSLRIAIQQSLKKGDDLKTNFRIIQPGGKICWIKTHCKIIYNGSGEEIKMLGTFRDITEDQKKEEILRFSEAKWTILTQNSFDFFTIIYSNWTIQFSSYSTQRILGYSPSTDLNGKSFLEFVHLEDVNLVLKLLTEITRYPDKIIQIRYRYQHKDGSWLFLESAISNYLGDDNEIGGIIINSHALTA